MTVNYMPMPEGAACSGSGPAHCCWIDGNPCLYLAIDIVSGRKYACWLRHTLGSWKAVYADRRYRDYARRAFDAWADDWPDCGDWWPSKGTCCGVT